MTDKIRLYACGGCGMNLGSHPLAQGLNPAYLDTSRANINDGVDPERCKIVDGVNGSGGVRKHNYQPIRQEVPHFLEFFEPADFNIVLFSTSGGTGSVAGPLLVSQLLKAGHAVVAIVVGNDGTAKAVENTVNTLKSLEAISADAGMPVVMAYYQNGSVSRGEVDNNILTTMKALSILSSQENQELDLQDVTHWTQYNKASNVPHQLAALHIYGSRQEAQTSVEPISIASLYQNPDQEIAFGDPKYNTVGYVHESVELLGSDQLHFVINHTDVDRVIARLEERSQDLNRTYSGWKNRKSLVDPDDNMTDDGIIL